MTNGKLFVIISLPMVNCSFCNKEIDRLVFCSPSHKVMFHRGKSVTPKAQKLKSVVTQGLQGLPKVNKPKPERVIILNPSNYL